MEKPGEPKPGRVRNAILIAGPTASGKSALALELAGKHHGAIVNVDSMQVYSGLRILTAGPGEADLARAPHHLYGHVDPAQDYSTGAWLRDVKALVDDGRLAGRKPIFVGGTGLYFRALTEGLSEMPVVPKSVRARWNERLTEEGVVRLHELLMRDDPQAAMRIGRTDGQRIVRALEVLEASGRSILDWQQVRDEPLVDLATADAIALDVARGVLIERIDRRLDEMAEQDVLGEVARLIGRGIAEDMPAMKAIGVREFRAVLEGRMSVDAAVAKAKTATHRYAKRQATWFRHQLGPRWRRLCA